MMSAVRMQHIFEQGEEAMEQLVMRNGDRQRFYKDTAFVALLKVCAKRKDLYRGSRLHAVILHRGLLKKNIFIGSILVHMYAKCGA
eukprot:c22681_g1_i1 orf=2-256(-)